MSERDTEKRTEERSRRELRHLGFWIAGIGLVLALFAVMAYIQSYQTRRDVHRIVERQERVDAGLAGAGRILRELGEDIENKRQRDALLVERLNVLEAKVGLWRDRQLLEERGGKR